MQPREASRIAVGLRGESGAANVRSGGLAIVKLRVGRHEAPNESVGLRHARVCGRFGFRSGWGRGGKLEGGFLCNRLAIKSNQLPDGGCVLGNLSLGRNV